jgi:putative peptidoglycan lipid II flippase
MAAADVTAPIRTTVYVGSVNLAAQTIDRLFAFGQIVVVAAFLGATSSADLLFLASIVPLTIGYVVGEPVGRAFLTLLVREEQPDAARKLAASAFVLTLGALVAVSAVYAVAASVLVHVITPGGSADLAPWLILSLIGPCAGVAGLLSGVLLWLHEYAWAAVRIPIASAASLGFMLLAAWVSGSLLWIAAALTAGYAVSAVLTYWIVARHLGLDWGFATTRTALTHAARVRSLMVGPVIGGAIGGQVIVTLERILAGAIVGTGSVAVISYARGIATAPTVLAQAVGASSYPRLVRAEAAGDDRFLRESFLRGLRLTIFLGVGCVTFLLLFGPAVVTALFERGKFERLAAVNTGRVVIAFAAAAFSGSLVSYLVPFIYGLNRFRSIIRVELAIFVVYLAGAPLAAALGGLTGLAITFAVAQACGAVTAFEISRRAVGFPWRSFGRVVALPILVPIAIVVVVEVACKLLVDAADPHVPVALRGIVRVGGGALSFAVAMIGALLLSPLPEASQLRRFFGRRPQPPQ